ncbi:MAG: HAD family hydrolase [Vicinamibacterales bacterium]
MLLVFDLDGTLIDSVRDLAVAANELVTTLGGRPLDQGDVAGMVGDGAPVLVKRVLAAAGLDPEMPDVLPQFLQIYDRHLLDTTVAYAGIDEALLMASRRARMAVLTNKPLGPSQRILEALGLLRYFDAVIGGDSPHGRKPDPTGLRTLSAGTPGVMLIGDSPIDAQTAGAAGCAFGWARYGFSAARFGAAAPDTPYVLDKPADLGALLDRFAAVQTGA